jgi:hypothetical protein
LLVTTSARAPDDVVARARRVAARCRAPFVARRRGLPRLLAEHDATVAYVATRAHDRLDDGQERLFVHEGLLQARLSKGLDHPLVRAVTGGRPARHVVDGTLGLAIDALHLAEATGARVLGIEGAAAIRSLVHEGLPRLARGGWQGARRVQPVGGTTHDVLRLLPDDGADAVFLAPMFEQPAEAAPGWDLLRPLAVHVPLDASTVAEALRVAPRVAVKLSPTDPVPTWAEGASWVRSKALRYAVLTRG